MSTPKKQYYCKRLHQKVNKSSIGKYTCCDDCDSSCLNPSIQNYKKNLELEEKIEELEARIEQLERFQP